MVHHPLSRGRGVVDQDGALYHLVTAAAWAGQVQAARAALARLPEPLRSRRAAGLAPPRFTTGGAAGLAHPGALHIILPGQEVTLLTLLPLTVLPGPDSLCRALHTLWVLTLGDLAALPPTLLTAVFGLRGTIVFQKKIPNQAARQVRWA